MLAVRNPGKAHAPCATWTGQTEVRRLDLASLESVRAFADGWDDDIDVLINNPGVVQTHDARTQDSFQAHIGVNHLGHSRSPSCCCRTSAGAS